jgi:hypothetical protein
MVCNQKHHPLQSEATTEAIVDALSSSLAILAKEHKNHPIMTASQRKTKLSQSQHPSQALSKESGDNSSSSTSSGGDNAAIVTTETSAATSSGGDDRDSTGNGGESNSDSNNNIRQISAHRSCRSEQRHDSVSSIASQQYGKADTASSGENYSWATQQHMPSHGQREGKHKKTSKRSNSFPFDHMSMSRQCRTSAAGSYHEQADSNGSSSGSGTEGGYAGSASSNDAVKVKGSNWSPSISSSEEDVHTKVKRIQSAKGNSASTSDPYRAMLSKRQVSTLSASSDLADFSSSSDDEVSQKRFAFGQASRSKHSGSSSSSLSSDAGYDDVSQQKRQADWLPVQVQNTKMDSFHSESTLGGTLPIMAVGCDIMAHILTYMEPPEILDTLTMPLSKDWLKSFTRQPELWRVLCLLEPFKAHVDSHEGSDSSDTSIDSYSTNVESELRSTFGKFRILYSSFVRCMRYLSRIKDDAVNGRAPSMTGYGSASAAPSSMRDFETNHSLQQFLARARGVAVTKQGQLLTGDDDNSDISDDENDVVALAKAAPIGVSDNGCATTSPYKRRRNDFDNGDCKKRRKVQYGHSVITQRLLGPTEDGTAGTAVELPWSCAIYSIVNWMVAFSDVEGIQSMCLRVLPFLLEDEQQRAGLTDIVLRGMVMFPHSAALHSVAFHTIVLLARPLGGQEGMLFHTSMVNSSGIFDSGNSETGKNGIAVMLDSMRRYQANATLQAMACWSLVNIALVPDQKEMLVKLGGIEVTANAMLAHPNHAEVQFRALFALINLVIPSVSLNANGEQDIAAAAVEDSSEKDMLDEMVDQIVNLVVQSMKQFCASEAILNRACLVLHNLSLTQEYHSALLWTPNCYQMLEWCLANYPADQVLQQSAAGTLHRLQNTLSSNKHLQTRFMTSLKSQQQLSLEQAHREAGLIHTQQDIETERTRTSVSAAGQ